MRFLSTILSISILFIVDPLYSANVNGSVSNDGTHAQCDFPIELHRRNTESKGLGLCVFTSIHHSAIWQNVPALQEFPKWVRDKGIAGGSDPKKTEQLIKQICKDRGMPVPDYVQVEGKDIDILVMACSTGRMPAITYGLSPTGRYNGQRIDHMVSLAHADGKQFAVIDNNYPGNFEWMNESEFKKAYTTNTFQSNGNGWSVILLAPRPPAPPKNR